MVPWKSSYSIIIIFVLALVLRLAFIGMFDVDMAPGDDSWHKNQVALRLINGEGYNHGHIKAYQPPLFQLMVAGIYLTFGESISLVRIIQAFIGAAVCLLLFYIGREMGSEIIGLVAGLVVAVFPQMVRYSVEFWSETLFVFLMLAGVYAVIRAEKSSPILWRSIAGVSFGLSALTREAGLILLFALLVWYLLVHRSIRAALARWSVVVLFAVLVISPWTIRNYTVFKTFVPISSNGGVNFHIGNNPQATGGFEWRLPPGAKWDVASPNGEAELEASVLGYRAGLRFIADNPLRFAELTAKRICLLFCPPVVNISLDAPLSKLLFRLAWIAMYFLLLVFSLAALRYIRGQRGRLWALFYLFILSQSLPYFITFVGSRYQLPLVPLMALMAAYGACRIFLGERAFESTKVRSIQSGGRLATDPD